jgi:competence protein ComEA
MAAPASAKPARARPRAPAVDLIWVDVAGAVRRPGLYSLPQGARVAAAITRAAGFRGGANRAAVNLAAKLSDGQQVFVPRRGPGGDSPAVTAPASGAAPPGSGATAGGAIGATVSLSSASQAELEQLDGVGPALAQRIMQYRDQHGGFRSVDELQQVSGIGPKRFEALKGSVSP